eukprot:CAMPEP_0198217200 /NCGR_PEP_ID=MMETSP1445-20131203/62199_1 /TAXON_ID=36898 /ORGANISM="Pyramimonas sp., Strain CCMP2087" /LENGTH=91 /DNA_ID=CAMNT_0043893781 /DNA_START=17 /DNA_END=292 /DNA_ORIENTATION=+
MVTATYVNNNPVPVTDFVLQAAVPTVMQLRLLPATGASLAPYGGNQVTQQIQVSNSMHGQKPLVMRLKIAFKLAGALHAEEATVNTFPLGV